MTPSSQLLNRVNHSAQVSAETGRPVRVIRGPEGNEDYSPLEGFVSPTSVSVQVLKVIHRYRYDGLYKVVRAWQEKGKAGFLMCKFLLQASSFPFPYTATN